MFKSIKSRNGLPVINNLLNFFLNMRLVGTISRYIYIYIYIVCTKTVDSLEHARLLATQNLDIPFSIHLRAIRVEFAPEML